MTLDEVLAWAEGEADKAFERHAEILKILRTRRNEGVVWVLDEAAQVLGRARALEEVVARLKEVRSEEGR